MPCFHPVPAWHPRPRFERDEATRQLRRVDDRSLVFSPHDGFVDKPIELPCGRCIGCVQQRASEWALRCEHEARLWRDNWFITLTYEEGTLPPEGSLVPKDLQDFWKRLRKDRPGLRYFACGEYGETFGRPHYHALVFNWAPEVSWRQELHGKRLIYKCPELEATWGLGKTHLAPFSGAAAQYVANYVRKNFSVGGARVDWGPLVPPFQTMSRRPGIGSQFVKRFMRDMYPAGFVTRPGGSKRRTPRYYDLVVERESPRMYRRVKRARAELAKLIPRSEIVRNWTLEEVQDRKSLFFAAISGRPFERAG